MSTQILKSVKAIMLPASHSASSGITKPSLKRLALAGGAWTAIGTVTNSAIRLGGNLIVTRLLAPEAFGLMAIVAVVLQAINMLSDTGVNTAVVQSDRGDDPDYLNTAWTVTVIREIILFLIACGLAWPIAQFYEQPRLLYLVPAVAAGSLCSGFSSTTLMSLRRDLEVGKLTILGTIQQFAGTGTTVLVAFFWPSVWALVLGSAVSRLARFVSSYCLPRTFKHRLRFDRQAAAHMYTFGRWIFLSTILTLASLYSDRLYLGKLTTANFLGVYVIAMMFAMFIFSLTNQLVRTVMYPSMTRIHRDSPHRLGDIYYRFRFWLDMAIQPVSGFFVTGGSWFIDLLYTPEYHGAGWILQILSIRSAMIGVLSPCETCLTSQGLSCYGFQQNLARAIWVCGGIPAGYYLAGVEGVIWAIGLSEIIPMAVLWTAFARRGLLRLERELWPLLCFAGGAGMGLLIVWLWP